MNPNTKQNIFFFLLWLLAAGIGIAVGLYIAALEVIWLW